MIYSYCPLSCCSFKKILREDPEKFHKEKFTKPHTHTHTQGERQTNNNTFFNLKTWISSWNFFNPNQYDFI